MFRYLYIAALFIASVAVIEAARPASVKIGLTTPVYKKTGTATWIQDGGGRRRTHAIHMAIDHINDKTDGLWDDILPNTQIEYLQRHSERDSGKAVVSAVEMIMTSGNENSNIAGLIGAASSGPTSSVQHIAKIYNVAQISFSATSPTLSDSEVFPTFCRTPPADGLQADAMAVYISQHPTWTCVNTISGSDLYSTGGMSAFQQKMNEFSTVSTVSNTVFTTGTSDMSEQIATIKASGCRLVLVFAQSTDLGVMMQHASDAGIVGNGWTWVMSETAGTNLNSVLSQLTASDPSMVMQGVISFMSTNGKGSQKYMELEGLWDGLSSTATAQWTGSSLEHVNCVQKTQTGTDLNGDFHVYRLHGSDYGDPTDDDPFTCAGIDFEARKALLDADNCAADAQSEAICADGAVTGYVPFSYDAAVALAYGLHGVIESAHAAGVDPDYADVYEHMRNASFTGFSGIVNFDENGDRAAGLAYNVLNHGGTSSGFNWIGQIVGPDFVSCDNIDASAASQPCADAVWSDGTGNVPNVAASVGEDEEDEYRHFLIIPAGIFLAVAGVAGVAFFSENAIETLIKLMHRTFLLCCSLTFELMDIISDCLVLATIIADDCEDRKDKFLVWYCLFFGVGTMIFLFHVLINGIYLFRLFIHAKTENFLALKDSVRQREAKLNLQRRKRKNWTTKVEPSNDDSKVAIKKKVSKGTSVIDVTLEFISAAHETNILVSQTQRSLALGGLLMFEDIPMAVINVMLLLDTSCGARSEVDPVLVLSMIISMLMVAFKASDVARMGDVRALLNAKQALAVDLLDELDAMKKAQKAEKKRKKDAKKAEKEKEKAILAS